MILVDTSVWINFFRGNDTGLAKHLRALLEEDIVAMAEPVRVEVLSGCSVRDLPKVRYALSGLPSFAPNAATWTTLDGWIEVAVKAGQRFGFADLLIGALASQNNAAVWSLDTDFDRLARLGFLTCHAPV